MQNPVFVSMAVNDHAALARPTLDSTQSPVRGRRNRRAATCKECLQVRREGTGARSREIAKRSVSGGNRRLREGAPVRIYSWDFLQKFHLQATL